VRIRPLTLLTLLLPLCAVAIFVGAFSKSAVALSSGQISPQSTLQEATWQCWDDGSSNPCRHNINAVHMLSEDSGWAVGDLGLILRWDGTAWTDFPSPTPWALYDIFMLSEDEGWAVGLTGKILAWDGISWTEIQSPYFGALTSVSMISATDGWIVGTYGRILRWNGDTWSQVNSPVSSSFYAVEMLSDSDGWIAGNNGITLRWNGSNWVQVANPAMDLPWPENWLKSISMLSENEGWIVGESGTIMRWDGESWSLVDGPTFSQSSQSIHILDSENGWAVGSWGGIMRWNGTNWINVVKPIRNVPSLNSVFMLSENNGLAAGEGGIIFQWDGNTWNQIRRGTLYSVDMISRNYGWAVGEHGLALNWQGSQWVQTMTPVTHTLHSVSMLTPNDGWAVGSNGTILKWDGEYWMQVSSPVSNTLRAVAMVSSSDVWAAGDAGTILRWNGSDWLQIASPTIQNLRSVSMLSSDVGWIVGDYGTRLRWDGVNFAHSMFSQYHRFEDVAMVSANDGWIVGNYYPPAGGALHWNGSSWSSVQFPISGPGYSFYSLGAVSGSDVWAVGTHILHWNGDEWHLVHQPATHILNAIDMVSPNEGWIVGSHGVILYYRGSEQHPEELALTGPELGQVESSYQFTSTIEPISTTVPLTYTWEATDHAPVVQSSSLTDAVTFTWSTPGIKTISVTAANEAGSVASSTVIVIGHAIGSIEPGISSTLAYTNSKGYATTFSIPSGAVAEPTSLVYTAHDSPASAPPAGLASFNHAFSLNAYQNGTQQAGFTFLESVVVTVNYDPAYASSVNEDEIILYYWDTQQEMWQDVATTCTPAFAYERQPGQVTVSLCHLTDFALFGPEQFSVYLPAVLR
jgi:photosystem II stability/assembly factor-like uncharacterized protein